MVMSVTFKTENSQVRLKWYKRTYSFNITLEFRTHEETGLMMFHRFSSETFPELPCRLNHVTPTLSKNISLQKLQFNYLILGLN